MAAEFDWSALNSEVALVPICAASRVAWRANASPAQLKAMTFSGTMRATSVWSPAAAKRARALMTFAEAFASFAVWRRLRLASLRLPAAFRMVFTDFTGISPWEVGDDARAEGTPAVYQRRFKNTVATIVRADATDLVFARASAILHQAMPCLCAHRAPARAMTGPTNITNRKRDVCIAITKGISTFEPAAMMATESAPPGLVAR